MLPQAKTRLCDAEWLNCVSPKNEKQTKWDQVAMRTAQTASKIRISVGQSMLAQFLPHQIADQ